MPLSTNAPELIDGVYMPGKVILVSGFSCLVRRLLGLRRPVRVRGRRRRILSRRCPKGRPA